MHLLNHQDDNFSSFLQAGKKFYKETYEPLTPVTSAEFFQELFLY